MSAIDDYAEVIATLARAEGALDTVENELLTVSRVIDDNAELRDRLTDTSAPLGQRLSFVESDALTAAHPATRTALATVIAAGKAADLRAIATAVAERAAAERERELAEVYVAYELDDERRRELKQALEQATGKQLEMKVFVDEDVVGGVRAKIGDTVIDGSVARRLDELRSRFVR